MGNLTVASAGNTANLTVEGGTVTVNGSNFVLANSSGAANYLQTGGNVTFSGTAFFGINNNGGVSTFNLQGGNFTSTVCVPLNDIVCCSNPSASTGNAGFGSMGALPHAVAPAVTGGSAGKSPGPFTPSATR